MEQSFSRPKLPGSARMRARGLFRAVIAIAILVAVPILLVFLFKQEASVRFNGVVESGAESVGPVEAARIVSREVVEGQKVKAGDVLVRFDPADRLLDDSINEVKIREYEQNLAKRRETLAENERRCRQLAREAEVRLEECRMDRVRDASELAGYEAEIERLKPLVEKKLVSELEFLSIRPKAEALRKTVSQYEPLLEALERRFEAAKKDVEESAAERASAEKEIEAAIASVLDAEKRSAELRKADPTVLRALTDGVVSKVYRRPGDIVAGGEPVLRVKGATDDVFVTGMLPIGMLEAVGIGEELYITRLEFRNGQSGQFYRGVVESIDSEVLDLFDPSNPVPRTPARGRKTRIRVLGKAEGLVPGETVIVADSVQRGLVGMFAHESASSEEKK